MKTALRVGILYSVGSPWARQLAIFLAKHGCEVHFFSFDSSGSGLGYLKNVSKAHEDTSELFKQHGVLLHQLPTLAPGLLKYAFAAPSLRKMAKKFEIDALLVLYAGGFGTLAFFSLFRPYALYTVGDDILILKGLRALLVNLAMHGAKKIFAHGGYLAKRTQLRTTKKVQNLVFGIDPFYFKPDNCKRRPNKFVCTRGFEEIYNNHLILQAANKLPPNLDFEIVFTSAGSLLEKEKQFLSAMPKVLQAKIKILGGVSRDELLNELQSATFFLSTSLSDGAAISVQEALSCGLFPIMSDIPSNREWLENNVIGIVSPLHDIEKFANSLMQAMTLSKDELRLASETNRQFILENCDARKNTDIIIDELRRLV